MSLIAQALVSLNDSHTYFVPPVRPYVHSYGYQTQMIGDRCYVIGVRPGSDAEAKGVKSGDEVLGIDGFKPERDTLWKIDYRYNVLRPQPTLALIIRDLKGQTRQLEVAAKVKDVPRISDALGSSDAQLLRDRETQRRLKQPRWAEAGDDVGVLKIPFFMFDKSEVDHLINKARKRSALIVDLRGNPGGAIVALKYLVGDVFEHDVKIAARLARGESKPEVARSRGSGAFTGKVIALVDSRSGSASELFARVLQLEKRGTVIGDRSSGAVMEAKRYRYQIVVSVDTQVLFGASITESDLIMSDGKSLEHVGVTPDEIVLPTASDLAAGRDPALARAAATLGVALSPEEAGKMFPYEWPPE